MSSKKESGASPELICITTLFPNSMNERHGIFVYNRLKKLIEQYGVKIYVIAPFPLRSKAAFTADLSSEKDKIFESVSRPRYLSIPILNRYISFFFIALAALPKAIKIVRNRNIGIIDSHYLYPDSVGASIVSRCLKLPLVNTARGSDVNYWSEKIMARYFIKHVMQNAKCNFAVSQKLAQKMKEIAPEAKIDVLPNGVDNEVFYFEKKSRLDSVNSNQFLSVGNLIPLKGHHLVIEALAGIPNAILEVIGHGPEKNNLIALAKRLNVGDRVVFLENLSQQELAIKYQTAHALVLASEMEGMPNVILEAMSCGLQVICTPVGDIPDIIDSNLGWVAERNCEAIRKAMTESISSPKHAQTIAEYANHKFGWENTIRDYYKAIRELCHS